MYKQAIVRKPGESFVNALTTQKEGAPDFALALQQHYAYCAALKECDLKVRRLEADESYPDSVFVEDAVICLPDCAVMTNPGPESRRSEPQTLENIIAEYFDKIERIQEPGTLDGGDVLEVEDHFYIGLSERTNEEGANQLLRILNKYGLTGSSVKFNKYLHLKSGVSYLGEELLVAQGMEGLIEFQEFDKIIVPDNESYAANAVMINGIILLAAGYPETERMVRNAGHVVITLDMSEFRKVDGGLSCLSLRF